MSKATFAAGCFWGVEEEFRQLKGVLKTQVGYTGGHLEKPTYRDVCTGATGHAEAVEIEFDDNIISYKELLDFFWKIHNPTTLNQQGPDVGSQYRSAIFTHNEEQVKIAQLSKEELNNEGYFPEPIVSEICDVTEFFPAETYHQQYVAKQRGEL